MSGAGAAGPVLDGDDDASDDDAGDGPPSIEQIEDEEEAEADAAPVANAAVAEAVVVEEDGTGCAPDFYARFHRPSVDPPRAGVKVYNVGKKFDMGFKREGDKALFATPLTSFMALFTRDLCRIITECTSLHLVAHGKVGLTLSELELWLALTIAMGIKVPPTVRSYWDTTSFGARWVHTHTASVLCCRVFDVVLPTLPFMWMLEVQRCGAICLAR